MNIEAKVKQLLSERKYHEYRMKLIEKELHRISKEWNADIAW